eukprot:10039505-Alexandrium_andersonii.AAC.1
MDNDSTPRSIVPQAPVHPTPRQPTNILPSWRTQQPPQQNINTVPPSTRTQGYRMRCELARKAQQHAPLPKASRNRNDPSGQALVARRKARNTPDIGTT